MLIFLNDLLHVKRKAFISNSFPYMFEDDMSLSKGVVCICCNCKRKFVSKNFCQLGVLRASLDKASLHCVTLRYLHLR